MKTLQTTTAKVISNTLYQFCNPGISLHMDCSEPKTGFAVSIQDGPNFRSVSSVNVLELESFIQSELNRRPLKSNECFGAWTEEETGAVFFDRVEIFTDKLKALQVAKLHEQIAIYDLSTGQEIKVANMDSNTINEVKEIKRLIKINNKLIDLGLQETAKFIKNCGRINNLLNGTKYNVQIGL